MVSRSLPLGSTSPKLACSGLGAGRLGRIGIASSEISGPVRNGGIGTGYRALAEALARAGHDVTLVYTQGHYCEEGSAASWIAYFAELGIRFVPLIPTVRFEAAANALGRSFTAYQWLKQRPFDVLHFPEWQATGYCSLVAKAQGLAFVETLLCVGTRSPTAWLHEANALPGGLSPEEAELDFLERRCVELADVVLSPCQYMLRWMRAQGWRTAPRVAVQRNVMPLAARRATSPGLENELRARREVSELVFFGRLETRKGMELFCAAIDLLVARGGNGFQVTFLGKPDPNPGADSVKFLEARTAAWPVPVEFATTLGQPAAVEYLAQPGRVAVVPSLMENCPNTVIECLGAGIPFLASDVGGTAEVIAPEEVGEFTFAPTPEALAAKLERVLSVGTRAARAAETTEENEATWIGWHADRLREIDTRSVDRGAAEIEPESSPLVSLVIFPGNRPERLRAMVDSIAAQDYSPREVLIAEGDEAMAEELPRLPESVGLTRFAAPDLVAARLASAQAAQGKYVLFLDEIALANRGALRLLVNAAERTGAAVVLAAMVDPEEPAGWSPREVCLVPRGGAVAGADGLAEAASRLHPLVRRDAFLALEGYQTSRPLVEAAADFCSRAEAAGERVIAVPELLFRRSAEWAEREFIPVAGEFPPLPQGRNARRAAERPLRVCVVSSEFLGPVLNGGIGTACSTLARALAAAGHEVTLYYLLERQTQSVEGIDHWIAEYARVGIQFVPLDATQQPPLDTPWPIRRSYLTYHWLKEHEAQFDVVHFPEYQGPGYFSLIARRQGLAFAETTFCVHAHSSAAWLCEANADRFSTPLQLELDFMERTSVALADVLISPSQYLIGWMKEHGWELPAQSFVQPYLAPGAARQRPPVSRGEPALPVRELVFFGRLERRKGLALFCDALDRLAGEMGDGIPDFRVTFLGKSVLLGDQPGHEYAAARASRWPFPWEVRSGEDQAGAWQFLQGPGRLAVMPSLLDNLPHTVLECLELGIPFLASDVGGIPELIREEDRAALLFPPRAADLACALRRVLQSPTPPAARQSSIDASANERCWLRWHESLPRLGKTDRPPATAIDASPSEYPQVSVCMTHWNRPTLLRQALASLRAQTYPNFEVILVDDGSTDPAALRDLDELEPQFRERGWQLIRQENRFLGAARNTGAAAARGEYLLFMDDDNFADPDEIETFVRVARRTGADIVSCAMRYFSGPDAPTQTSGLWVPMGPAPAVGLFRNCFGDTNSMIRRSTFERVGGFTEDLGMSGEDWELHARAVLAGYRLEVIPEPLFWYRITPGSVNRWTNWHLNRHRAIRPYLAQLPAPLAQILGVAQLALRGAELKIAELERTIANTPKPPVPSAPPAVQKRVVVKKKTARQPVPKPMPRRDLAHYVAKWGRSIQKRREAFKLLFTRAPDPTEAGE